MIKNLLLILLILTFISCNKNKYITEFYSSGKIKLKVQINEDSIQNGTYEEFFENGELKSKTEYINGNIADTLFYYYSSGKIKEKGMVKNAIPNEWWLYYRENGTLKEKSQWISIGVDSIHKNQSIYYDQNGNIDFDNSSFFILKIPDTLILGRNIAFIEYHSNQKPYKKLTNIIIENHYSENEKKLDSFRHENNDTYFGIFAHKKGLMTINGQILETLFDINNIGNDSALGTVSHHKKYFKKDVFVHDSDTLSEKSRKLLKNYFEKEK